MRVLSRIRRVPWARVGNLRKETHVKQLLSFMETCSWFWRFIADFAKISKPPTTLSAKWIWNPEHDRAFKQFKKTLSSAPILQTGNLALHFNHELLFLSNPLPSRKTDLEPTQ
uniref:Reverse transcriptase/retrotransposon-derived protein RNase H-like domain-containing protein n=1 Tax=Photinus pyralis TaxID=7054 RepID=A0A1Y1KYA3_PHOPY